MNDIMGVLRQAPVIPVVTLDDAEPAVELARALHDGGIRVIEITLRTAAATRALEAIKRSVPDMCLGMGTVWSGLQVHKAAAAGADFIVSPGIADDVADSCDAMNLAYLPGAQTVSEVAYLMRRGALAVKLFPAAVIGGPAAIAAYASVFPSMTFCPTGGIDEQSAADYLALPSVACVGGSWLARPALVQSGDWPAIRQNARRAAELGQVQT